MWEPDDEYDLVPAEVPSGVGEAGNPEPPRLAHTTARREPDDEYDRECWGEPDDEYDRECWGEPDDEYEPARDRRIAVAVLNSRTAVALLNSVFGSGPYLVEDGGGDDA